ncbi:MAG: hypothetical protein QOI27_2317, partial [Gaiellaceae bacterium]|nr:hypothetical protein [Gaiellaceae bacterium]
RENRGGHEAEKGEEEHRATLG